MGYSGPQPVGSGLPVEWATGGGTAYVEIREVQPSEALVLVNDP